MGCERHCGHATLQNVHMQSENTRALFTQSRVEPQTQNIWLLDGLLRVVVDDTTVRITVYQYTIKTIIILLSRFFVLSPQCPQLSCSFYFFSPLFLITSSWFRYCRYRVVDNLMSRCITHKTLIICKTTLGPARCSTSTLLVILAVHPLIVDGTIHLQIQFAVGKNPQWSHNCLGGLGRSQVRRHL